MLHGPDQLLLQLLAIFVSAKLLGELFEQIQLPSVLGEILAGATLGPFALGWIVPSDTIHSIAEIGAIFVLFSAGLETSPQDLIRVDRQAMLVAVAGIILPFGLGFAYMTWRGDASSEAIFVGAAMVATSVGITARVLADLQVLATRTAKIILGAAVFDDQHFGGRAAFSGWGLVGHGPSLVRSRHTRMKLATPYRVLEGLAAPLAGRGPLSGAPAG